MIQKLTKTIVDATTGRAESFSELKAAGWQEREVCLLFSDYRQAFCYNAAVKSEVRQKHLKYTDSEGKTAYRDMPEKLTAEMLATAKAWVAKHPLAYEKFETATGPGKGWLERAKTSGSITTLGTLKGAAREKFLADFKSAKGFDCTVENIAAAMKRDFEAAPKSY